MKFTLFALVAALCLLSVHADSSVFEPAEENLEYFDMDTDMDMDLVLDEDSFFLASLFSPTWKLMTTCLRTVKGFHCLINWTRGIKYRLLQFNIDAAICGVQAVKEYVTILKMSNQTVTTSDDAIELESNVCSSEVTGIKTNVQCTLKSIVQFFRLFIQTKNILGALKKIPQTGPNAKICMNGAVNNLITYFTKCPQTILTCSKLSSS